MLLVALAPAVTSPPATVSADRPKITWLGLFFSNKFIAFFMDSESKSLNLDMFAGSTP